MKLLRLVPTKTDAFTAESSAWRCLPRPAAVELRAAVALEEALSGGGGGEGEIEIGDDEVFLVGGAAGEDVFFWIADERLA